MANNQYPRTGLPYEFDEIIFIIWNARNWGTDQDALEDIAKIVKRSPRSIKLLLQGGT